MYGVYATLEEVKTYLQGEKAANFSPNDDGRIIDFCVQMSRKFDTHCKRKFVPTLETRYYDHPREEFTPQRQYFGYPVAANRSGNYPAVNLDYSDISRLRLDDDLLQVSSFTTQNGNTTISASDYFLMTGESYNYPPYDSIQLKLDGDTTTLSFSGTPQRANAVTGLWGYHERFADSWSLLDTVQDDPLSSSATTLTVVDVDGVDDLGLTPRFKTQQLCRFGTGITAEMFYITSKDPDNDTLTIVRGVNGTTAAQQAQGTSIYLYRPMDEIKHALLVLAAWAYRRKDTVGGIDDQPVASPTGVVIMPSTLPGEVKDMLRAFKSEVRG